MPYLSLGIILSYSIPLYIYLSFPRLVNLLVEGREDSSGVGTDDIANLLAVLEDNEGGHGADAKLLGEVGKMVDVELGEVDLVLELLVLGPPLVGGKGKQLANCFICTEMGNSLRSRVVYQGRDGWEVCCGC